MIFFYFERIMHFYICIYLLIYSLIQLFAFYVLSWYRHTVKMANAKIFPYELYKRGGWLNPQIVDWFGDYARLIAERFSDRVKNFFTCPKGCPVVRIVRNNTFFILRSFYCIKRNFLLYQ